MKKLRLTDFKVLLVLLFACSVKLQAQVTDTAKTVRRDTLPYKQNNNQQYLYSTRSEKATDSVTEKKLVELALRQPKFDEAAAQRKTIDLQLEKQRKAWLNLLSLSVNYNDQTFAGKSNTQTAYVYPKYFFGVTIPLGLIFSGGTDYKITKQSGIIARDQELELQQTIKAQVLSDYRQYRTYDKLLAIQNQSTDDAQAYFLHIQQKFADGSATLEAYNDASAKYNAEVVKTINMQLQQDLIKLDLERLIGRRLEDIFK
jgi:outer membrane protein TolC